MGITEPNAASRSQVGAAMVSKKDLPEIFQPETVEEAVSLAVRDMLRAANTLCTAADMAPDGEVISHYITTAIRLRDIANSLQPDQPDWPANVIPFAPRFRG